MPKFSYKVRDRDNRVMIGTMEGSTSDEVADRLSEMSFLPVEINELGFDGTSRSTTLQDAFKDAFKSKGSKVPFKDLVLFTRQLGTMVGQGVTLSRSLEQLQKGEKPVFQAVIKQVADDISTGFTFSDAIARHPTVFNQMYVAVCQSGEVAGALDRVLEGLANYLEDVYVMRQKVKTATRYPTVLFIFVTIMVVGILYKLVPTFENIYKGMGANLPIPTQILITLSHVVRDHFILAVIAIIAAFIGLRVGMNMPGFKVLYDRNVLRVPVIGGVLTKSIWAVFSRTMALLLDAGTPILKAVEIASAAVDNRYYASRLERVYTSLKRGTQLSEALESCQLFPVLIIQLTSTGESSGKVDAMLSKAAEFYEREIKSVVDNLAALLEPILIVILGGIVGAILIALYLPIFKMGQYIH
jgi:type IV pilus assembly protein PilC